MRALFKKAAIFCFTLFLFGFPALSTAIQHTVPTFTAQYKLSHNDIEIGHVTLEVKTRGNTQYQLVSSTQTSGLLALIRDDDVVERSLFELTKEHIRPLSYHYIQSLGIDNKDVQLQFNWKNKLLTTSAKGEDWHTKLPTGVLDKALMQIALMIDLTPATKNLSYQIADGGRLKKYTFTVLGEEIITVGHAQYRTIKLARKKDNKPLITYYWCATTLHNLPILIQREKSYGTFEMRLQTVKFNPLTP